MKMKLIAAAALALSGASSFALTTDLGPLTSSAKGFGDFFAAGEALFADTFTFSLASTSTVSGVTGYTGIGSFGLVLLSGTTPVATDSTPESFSFSNLAAGNYALEFVGFNAAPGSFYGGNVSAAPVPEPETLAMMLAGLGAVGFMAMRRGRN